LNPRRLKSEEIRFSTPGRSSTITTNVWGFIYASSAVSTSGLGRRIIACRSAPAGTIG
jgi:hypothetical protein